MVRWEPPARCGSCRIRLGAGDGFFYSVLGVPVALCDRCAVEIIPDYVATLAGEEAACQDCVENGGGHAQRALAARTLN